MFANPRIVEPLQGNLIYEATFILQHQIAYSEFCNMVR